MRQRVKYLILGIGILLAVTVSHIYVVEKNASKGILGDEIISVEMMSSEEKKKIEVVQEPDATETDTKEETIVERKENKENSYPKIESKQKVHLYATGTARIGDTAYEQYSYVESTAKKYASVVDKMSQKIGEQSILYSCIVPTSAGITVPDNKKDKIKSDDQYKAIKKIEKKYKGAQKVISLYDTMMQHRTEYIYFRTDHHWTPLGAYYAYRVFCEKKGIEANDLSKYKKKNFKNFKGSFYRDTNKNKTLRADTIKAIYPLEEKMEMYYRTVSGQKIHAPLIDNANRYGQSLKYCAYIAGDNPITVIKNKKKKDGSSCVVVKESFGNVFVPYLADHYETVYAIDYRYYSGKLSEFVKKRKIKEVILLNNISMTRNNYLVSKLAGIL